MLTEVFSHIWQFWKLLRYVAARFFLSLSLKTGNYNGTVLFLNVIAKKGAYGEKEGKAPLKFFSLLHSSSQGDQRTRKSHMTSIKYQYSHQGIS